MRRSTRLIFAMWFAISMTMAQAWRSAAQTSTYSRSEPGEVGHSGGSSDSNLNASGYTPEQTESQALTEYLKQRKLPLVGAQVLRRTGGRRMVVLYGFVGSDFGKTDAASKARRFLHDSSVEVDNRINVRPELLASNRPAAGAATNPYGGYPPASSNSGSAQSPSADTSRYPGPESYKAQQASPYTQQLTSMMPLIALLGVLGMGIAGGGSGFSFGSSPYGGSPYGSPYSSPGAPYASPYGPYGSSPFGASPYGRAPFGNPYSPAPYPYP
ncbi:MAG: hypothetical protein JO166_04430 [Deltaproteobacteria bacterium]|nr:hypothetical protein [Deltaproteobacteria bacterium]